MRFAHFFVDRPRFAVVVSIVVVVLGIVGYIRLPVTEYPQIAPPTIVVRALYPGASAQTLATTVATPIEQEVNGVEGMLYMSSYSTGDGVMALTITFKTGTNLDLAQVLVQNRVRIAEPRLPEDVRRLGLTVQKTSPDLMMVVHMLSPDNSLDELYISNYTINRVRNSIIRIDGVGEAFVFGAREFSMRVWLDPERLSSLGLSGGDIVAAMREQNVQVSGGALGQQPIGIDVPFQVTVTTQGRFDSVDQFRKVIIRASSDGRVVRLGDVARVELGARDYSSNSYMDGKSAAAIGVYQRPGSNALETADAIKATMADLKNSFPAGLDYAIVYNPTDFIRSSVNAVYKTLGEAIILVAFVVLIFLQSWRAAIIPIIAIPVALIGTFAVMDVAGFSLNVLTLFGLVLAIGIVVDDAIVVVENIERNVQAGMSGAEAAHATIQEVGGACVAIAVVLSAVFIPTAFVPGISGAFYRQFALTIAVATILSAINALTLSPALGALLIRGHGHGLATRNPLSRLGGFLALGFNRGFGRLSHAYGFGVGRILRHRFVMLSLYVGLAAATFYLGQRIPTGFIPQLDRGFAIVVIQLPDGASLGRTDEVTRRAADIVKSVPGVAHTVAISGLSGATFTSASNSAVIFTTFTPFEERLQQGVTLDTIIRQLYGRLVGIEEAFVFVVPPAPVPGIGSQGGFKLQLQNLDNGDVTPILGAAYQIMAQAQANPGVKNVFTTFSASYPQVYIEIDRDKAALLNVPIGTIFEALQIYLGSSYVNDFNVFGRIYQVRAQADARFRTSQASISTIKVRSTTGASVPLGTLVRVLDTSGPELVQRYNQYVSVPLQGTAAVGVSSNQALAIMDKIVQDSLPPGMSYEWTELALQQKLSGDSAIYIFGLSILFVFLALAAQYESWLLPFSIILIVPLSTLSGFLGIMARGMDNNILVQVGLVVLVGLATKNAILMVEFARHLESGGSDRFKAAAEASRLRLRPILMTAFAFILGVLPLMIATGPGAEMRQALGTTVFSGMLGVTVLGLLLTPVLYVAVGGSRGRIVGKPAA